MLGEEMQRMCRSEKKNTQLAGHTWPIDPEELENVKLYSKNNNLVVRTGLLTSMHFIVQLPPQ